jgi:hypothetical protein
VSQDRVTKVLYSSGTTGAAVSRIYLDAETSAAQAHVLVKIIQQIVGKNRLPMVIVDRRETVQERHSFSARSAGILGLLQFGRNPFYALKSDMSLDLLGLTEYVAAQGSQEILFFGFTFIVWQHLILDLVARNARLHVPNGVLLHSGGWKKLEGGKVSPSAFAEKVEDVCGIRRTTNFYGMVEQVGSVFLENSKHYLQAPIYSEILVRDPVSLEVVPHHASGLVQVLSMLPESYPGHSILTEDIGAIEGEDDADVGMNGKFFRISGRVPRADLRGCSDTYTVGHETRGV